MLLDRPMGRAESRGFVHKRIIGGIGGFLTGGPAGAVGGFIGGGSPVIPTGPTDFSGNLAASSSACIPPFRVDPRTGRCTTPFLGSVPGPDPRGNGSGERFDGSMHHPHAPMVVSVATRRCGRGHVLSWRGECVSKKDIRNSDRMYPKPRRPLGTPGELNAVTKAKRFSTRLVNSRKSLKKTAQNFAKAAG